MIKLSENLTSIGNSAFSYCIKLYDITIPNSVTSIGNNTFGNCYNHRNIQIKEDNIEYSNYQGDGIVYNKNITTIIIYPAGKENDTFFIPNGSILNVSGCSFSNIKYLENIIFGENITNI